MVRLKKKVAYEQPSDYHSRHEFYTKKGTPIKLIGIRVDKPFVYVSIKNTLTKECVEITEEAFLTNITDPDKYVKLKRAGL